MSGMDDLVTWLRAQLDEDEGLARMAFAEHNKALAEWNEPWSGTVQIGPDEDDVCCNDSGVSRHIVNWDPARALAEVDAKRRIIDEAIRLMGYDGEFQFLELLALPYADRPGYQQQWRPA